MAALGGRSQWEDKLEREIKRRKGVMRARNGDMNHRVYKKRNR
jgi:hypothetical protein